MVTPKQQPEIDEMIVEEMEVSDSSSEEGHEIEESKLNFHPSSHDSKVVKPQDGRK